MTRRLRKSASALVAVATLLAGACGSDDAGGDPAEQVGKSCTVVGATPDAIQLHSKSPDCASQLCISYLSDRAHCTQPCFSDAECPAAGQQGCALGFACRIGGTSGGAYNCCRVCVCKDVMPSDLRDAADPAEPLCQGVQARCGT